MPLNAREDCRAVPDAPIQPIESFRDAVGFAMELADRHAFVAAIALLGPDGRPIDVVTVNTATVGPFGAAGAEIEPVVAWAAGLDGWRCQPCRALLVSVRAFDPEIVREQDLHHYRQARWSLARSWCDLIDWIETDGDLFRSYAYLTCPAEAWTNDPPGHRLSDGA